MERMLKVGSEMPYSHVIDVSDWWCDGVHHVL